MQPQNPIRHAIGRALSGFLAMLPVLLGVYWLDPDLSALALTDFALGLRRLLPVFGVMLVLMVLVNLWVKPQRIARHLGEESGLRGWAIAITAGVVSLGPMYLWYPMLGELKEKGVRTPLLAAFLYSRAVKIPMLPMMVHYFGLRMKHPGMIFLERKGSQGGLNP